MAININAPVTVPAPQTITAPVQFGGLPGSNGLSAYAIAVAEGFVGTQQEWVASLQGTSGGIQILGSLASVGELPITEIVGDAYLINGDLYIWDSAAWVNTGMVQGPAGEGVPVGGTAGQVLKKASGADYDSTWADPSTGVSSWNDLTDKPAAFPPSPHAVQHAVGGVDAVSPASIGAAPASHTHNAASVPAHNNLSGLNTGDLLHLTAAEKSRLDGLEPGGGSGDSHDPVTAGDGISVTDQVVTNADRGSAAVGVHETAYPHTDIAHTNRAALNQVSGTNTGDQDLSQLQPKETGKGLSTNDYTNVEKDKVAVAINPTTISWDMLGIYVGTVEPPLTTFELWDASRTGYWAWIDISTQLIGSGLGSLLGVAATTSVANWTAEGVAPNGVAELIGAMAETSVGIWTGNGGLPTGLADLIGVEAVTSVGTWTGTGAAAQGIAALLGVEVTTSVGTWTGEGVVEAGSFTGTLFGTPTEFTLVGADVQLSGSDLQVKGGVTAVSSPPSYAQASISPAGNFFVQFTVSADTTQWTNDANAHGLAVALATDGDTPLIVNARRVYSFEEESWEEWLRVDAHINIGGFIHTDLRTTHRIEVEGTTLRYHTGGVLRSTRTGASFTPTMIQFAGYAMGDSWLTISNVSAGDL